MNFSIDAEVIAKLLAPVLSAITAALVKKLRPAVRLVTYYGHASKFHLKPDEGSSNPPIQVHTHSFIVQNMGAEPAHNVRLLHFYLPINVSLFPAVAHQINPGEDGTGEIVLPVLAPKEQVTVSYLYYPPLLYNQTNHITKCDEGLAKHIHALPTPQPPTAVKAVVWALVFLGATLVFYILARLTIYGLSV